MNNFNWMIVYKMVNDSLRHLIQKPDKSFDSEIQQVLWIPERGEAGHGQQDYQIN